MLRSALGSRCFGRQMVSDWQALGRGTMCQKFPGSLVLLGGTRQPGPTGAGGALEGDLNRVCVPRSRGVVCLLWFLHTVCSVIWSHAWPGPVLSLWVTFLKRSGNGTEKRLFIYSLSCHLDTGSWSSFSGPGLCFRQWRLRWGLSPDVAENSSLSSCQV